MDEANPIRVLVVDDHETLRASVKGALAPYLDIKHVGEAENGLEAIQRCAETKPDVILMDFSMPILNGVKAAEAIRKKHPDIRIILWSLWIELDTNMNVELFGVDRLLSKNLSIDGLVREIRGLANFPKEDLRNAEITQQIGT